MTGIASEDLLPLLAASVVMVLGNVVGYANGWTVQMSILFTPLALLAFGIVRYTLHGNPLPDGLREV